MRKWSKPHCRRCGQEPDAGQQLSWQGYCTECGQAIQLEAITAAMTAATNPKTLRRQLRRSGVYPHP